jgi:hypothetical protein
MYKKMAATTRDHFNTVFRDWLILYGRYVARHASPLAVRHLDPGIGPTHVLVHSLPDALMPLDLPPPVAIAASPNTNHFHVFIFDTVMFGGFRFRKRLSFVADGMR